MNSLIASLYTLYQEYSQQIINAAEIYGVAPINLQFSVSEQDMFLKETLIEPIKSATEEILKNAFEATINYRWNYVKNGISGLLNPSWKDSVRELAIPRLGNIVHLKWENMAVSIRDFGCGLPLGYEELPFEAWETTRFIKPGNQGVKLASNYIHNLGGTISYARQTDGTLARIGLVNIAQ